MKISSNAATIADHTEQDRGSGMVTADPTFFWIFLIGFGVIALRILERTHREPERRVPEPIRSSEDR